MGKIMLNGIQYGVGGIEQAKDISYDNTESGATATDVQGALDELNAGLTNVSTYSVTTTTSSTIVFKKIGRIVMATHIGVVNYQPGQTVHSFATLPEEVRPIDTVAINAFMVTGNNIAGSARLAFYSNGSAIILPMNSSYHELWFTVTYISIK